MANIGLDGRIHNNENAQSAPFKSKQMLLNENRFVKKQVFGELKNVLPNQQIGSTPFKGNAAKIDGLPGKFSASSSLCNDVLRKQQLKQNFLDAQNKLEQKYKKEIETYKEPVFDEELFDSWDYDRQCCEHEKSEANIWSEIDAINMNFENFQFHTEMDEDEKDVYCQAPDLFHDLDDTLKLLTFDADIDFVPTNMLELPPILDQFEELSF